MKFFIKTMGCQMNVHDSEKIAGIFSESGYDQSEESKKADVIVLNTCSIRQKAEQKFYSELGRLKEAKKHNPDLKIAVAGCIAQQEGSKLFKKFPYVDFIFGPDNIDNLQKWITNNPETGKRTEALKANPSYHTKELPIKREGRVKTWVSIMYGCDNFCAYCVVPFTRGRERSRPKRDIQKEVERLASEGFKEVTLLGQNVNSYGKGLNEKTDFPDLLSLVHGIEGVERIRFVTSHPKDLSEGLITAIQKLPKVCEHIHLPLQSGSDKVLTMMNRRYIYEEYKEKIDKLREGLPGIAITTDIITGFPGESDDDFQCTMDALSDIEFDGIFAFKYSKRPNTMALSLPGHIDEEIKSERLSRVSNLQEAITYKKNKAVEGEIHEVLIESVSETDSDKLTGRTRGNKVVNFYGDERDIGRLIKVKILEAKRHSLYGERV
ncbi:MAG: tRNA (N6-isopentenyl adenosine(37)-C2)-methylthiotransferase MiaB [Nitrospirae bacterium]|nr:tRNA (N6-isopentenyl adenosine(37)-C2)-methylthiotransferase MiaB [Nitrospirota bacterium]